jgi:hypothetical protein
MATSTPEPSFQPGGQDQGLTQGRPAWQRPADYTPPGGSSAGSGSGGPGTGGAGSGGQAYAAPPPPAYTFGEQSYPAQGYPAPDPAYATGGQDYQGYQQQYPQAYQGQGAPPQWQSAPGQGAPGKVRSPRPKGEKGLVGSLFDFSFSSMVTPKIIKALYVLFTIWTIIAALIILVFFDKTGGIEGALFAFFIIDPIFILLSLGIYRIVLEAFMVIFQIHGELKTIRTQGEEQS